MLELPQPGFPSPWEERMPGVVDETLFTFHVSVRSRVYTGCGEASTREMLPRHCVAFV